MAEPSDQNGTSGTGRALVALAPAAPRRAAPPPPHVPLVAQLLAGRLDLPQARARRRCEAAGGAAAYVARGEAPCASRLHRCA